MSMDISSGGMMSSYDVSSRVEKELTKAVELQGLKEEQDQLGNMAFDMISQGTSTISTNV